MFAIIKNIYLVIFEKVCVSSFFDSKLYQMNSKASLAVKFFFFSDRYFGKKIWTPVFVLWGEIVFWKIVCLYRRPDVFPICFHCFRNSVGDKFVTKIKKLICFVGSSSSEITFQLKQNLVLFYVSKNVCKPRFVNT